MNKELQEKLDTIKKNQSYLEEAYQVKKIGIFGSFVRDEQNQKSDLDVLVEFYEAPSLFKFINLEKYLSDTLKKKVDLVSHKAIKPIVKNSILREVIYA